MQSVGLRARHAAFTSAAQAPRHTSGARLGLRPGSICQRRHLLRSVVVRAEGEVALLSRIKEDTKTAMKARAAARLTTIRFLSSAIKNREIELRQEGRGVTERDVLEVVQKLVKQSKVVVDDFIAAGRPEAAEEEASKLKVWEEYLPTQLSEEELAALVAAAVAETGAASVKQMGQVMKVVVERAQGRADSKRLSEMVKAALTK